MLLDEFKSKIQRYEEKAANQLNQEKELKRQILTQLFVSLLGVCLLIAALTALYFRFK